MHQRDWILRVIEQLGAALAELRRRILRQERGGAIRKALADTAAQAGYDIELLRSFDVDTLHMFVAPTGEVDPTRDWLMAEILYLDGLERALGSDPASDGSGRDSLVKARSLYDLVRPAGGMLIGMPEAAERITEIDRLLHGGDEPTGRVRYRRRRLRAAARASARRAAPRTSAPRAPAAARRDAILGSDQHRAGVEQGKSAPLDVLL